MSIERAGDGELLVGNLDIERDFLHVKDGVQALATIAARGNAGEAYNVCSGQGWKLRDILAAYSELARARISIRLDASKIRPIDERIKVGDCTKLQALDWREKLGVRNALEDILGYWRDRS